MFELFEHRADIGIRGLGRNREEAVGECARAMFSVIADVSKVKAQSGDDFEAEAESLESLLVNFLNELLYLHEVKEKVYSGFEVYITGDGNSWKAKGKAFGERINAKKHSIKGDVKAASYHQLKVAEEKGKWVAQCVLDI
jgi:SHS2 domain-containing protein